MEVYFAGQLIVIETNVAWALPYWTARKRQEKRITWRLA
jgi:hypothetical protein